MSGAAVDDGSGLSGRRAAWLAAGWLVLPAAALMVPVALAAAAAPWPSAAAASLLLGLATVLVANLRGGAPLAGGTASRPMVVRGLVTAVGVLLAGAGTAGALPVEGTTIAALGLVLATAAAIGSAGRDLTARVAGWQMAVTAGLLLAYAAALAAGLDARQAAYPVLGAAALALALAAVLGQGGRWRSDRATESVAVEVAAHVGAVVAFLLSVGSVRQAAAVCTLWGVAVGVRALLLAPRPAQRAVTIAAAAGVELLAWWLLLAAEEVALIEAYTLPAAAVGLLAGWLALRQRPGLSSWLAYGPALGAAFLPSLASVLVTEGGPVRRLVLGLGGLAVLLAGSAWRRQAPVVCGGVVVGVVALHETILVWDHLPRWIPLALAGLLLVGLAMTLERRRRDVARVRAAIARMT